MNDALTEAAFATCLASPQQMLAFRSRGAETVAVQAMTAPTALPLHELVRRLAAIERRDEVLRCALSETAEGVVQTPRAQPAAVWLGEIAFQGQADQYADGDAGLDALAQQDRACLRPADGRLLLARPIWFAAQCRVLLTASAEIADLTSILAVADALVADEAGHGSQVAYPDYAGWRAEVLAEAGVQTSAATSQQMPPARLPEPYGDPSPPGEARIAHVFEVQRSSLAPDPQVLLAALWAYYLGRQADRSAMTLLHRFDGRAAPQLAGAIGPYEQILPVEYQWNADEPVSAYIQRVDACLRNVAARQDQIFPLGTARGAFAAFDSLVLEQGGAIAVGLRAPAGDLEMVVRLRSADVRICLTANAVRYAAADLTRVAGGFRTMLDAVAADPNRLLGELPCIGAEEARRLHSLGTGRDAAFPDIVDAFRAVAAHAGAAKAAIDDRGAVDYRTLDASSDAVAHQIASRLHEFPDGVVPVLTHASVDFIAMVLGVLKAGLAFAPLDPSHPTRRLAALVAQLRASSVLASRECEQLLRGTCGVMVPDNAEQAVHGPFPHQTVAGTAIAYVLFTSGSTGVPKGVRVTRAGITNYLHWACETYPLADPDGALVHTSTAVDLTMTALLGPLLCGGVVVLPGARNALSVAIASLSENRRIGVLKTTPSLLRTIMNSIEPGGGRVGTLVLGGEPLTGRDLGLARERFGDVRIFNEYGPTETVVGSAAFDATNWRGEAADPVPIGTPIAGTRVAVLDRAGQPAPFGTPGELLIAGAGVAAGYVNAAEEAAGRFISTDLGPAYLTGDLVRWTAGGTLVALGRVDDEFKVNGVRCNPAEIEAALEAVPGVIEAAAALRLDAAGHARLVAWFMPGRTAPTAEALREALAGVLPAPLVPSRLIRVDAIPRTASGKRDRANLTEPDPATDELPFTAPQDDIEELLAAIFASVLGVERVGRDDDYFALGGDSLRSVQVSSLARRRGLDVSVAQLHANPVLSDLAAAVRDGDPLLDEAPPTQPFQLISEEDRRRLPVEVEDAYPLNLLQEGMIYHRDFAPKSAVYHAICSYRIRARLDIGLMRRVIHDLVARHPLLRTSFDLTTYSQPLQLVHREFVDPVTIVDLRDGSPAAFDAAVDGWMAHEKGTGFEVYQHPLIRYCLHVGANGVFQLSYSFHHEIIDGWSDAYMVTELLRDYFSRLNGEDFVPEKPSVTFRDSIVQEQIALANVRFRDFWMAQFADAQLMRLPRLDTPHRADKGVRQIVKFEIPIDDAMSDGIKALARSLAVPIKTVLLAAHMRVMSVMGGGRDTTSYTVGNGRPENADGHRVIGLFVNSLAFRQQMPGGTWRQLIHDTLSKERAVLPYRRYPMAELKRQAGNEPLSETLFFFNHYHVADVLEARQDAELLDIKVYGESTFPYCINAYISPMTKKVGMRAEYDALQFTPRLLATMERVYLNVIRSMLADPDARYDVGDLLPPAEREEVLAWSTGAASAESPPDVVAQIDTAIRAYPDRIAVIHDGEHQTYRAFDRVAGRVAAWLGDAGVRPGRRVALALSRSVYLPAVIVGVLRAGCAYVPLDPQAPPTRLNSILEDARPDVLIAPDAMFGARAVTLETLLSPAPGRQPVRSAVLAPELPAYMIYTSGSTGAPKGVEISHGALARSNAARQGYFRGGHEVFLLLSSVAFDSSVAGLFGTLTAGGTLVLPSGPSALELADLATLVAQHRVTQTLAVPSLYSAVLQEVRAGAVSSLRTVSVAGEAVMSDLVSCHRQTFPDVRLVNEYGPTEATVWASAWSADVPVHGAAAPCGTPIPDMRCLILDGFGAPAPIGVAGEAFLAGPLLSNGYPGRPAETAAAFRPLPLMAKPGERMYATGDVMRWNAAGQLEFLGRKDGQVKIDGFRIELGDVEAALLTHPRVRTCAVQPKEDSSGRARLVAYATGADQAPLDPGELAAHLRGLLPRFMLPRAFVVLDRLPLSAGGKLDRAALPEPADGTGPEPVLPRTPTEEVIAGIWSRILGVENPGVNQEFFASGGDSLRAMRIAAGVRKALGVQPPVKLMMSEACTVADLADAVQAILQAKQTDTEERADDGLELVRV